MAIVSSGFLESRLLNKELPYQVILPNDYGKESETAPVLYLLHGLFGNYRNWIELTNLVEYAKARNFIIVTPEGEDGWYVDSSEIESNQFESYFVLELIREIDRRFNTKQNRNGRAVVGLSMGGYGAIRFGFKFPELFGFVGSISGAFDAMTNTKANHDVERKDLIPSILGAFGKEGSMSRKENDLFDLVEKNYQKIRIPELILDCGDQDFFRKTNVDFHDLLVKLGIPHEFTIAGGGHDWDYWDARIKIVLQSVEDFFFRQESF